MNPSHIRPLKLNVKNDRYKPAPMNIKPKTRLRYLYLQLNLKKGYCRIIANPMKCKIPKIMKSSLTKIQVVKVIKRPKENIHMPLFKYLKKKSFSWINFPDISALV
jgi:hypothetical protein